MGKEKFKKSSVGTRALITWVTHGQRVASRAEHARELLASSDVEHNEWVSVAASGSIGAKHGQYGWATIMRG